MSKELNTLEIINDAIEVATNDLTTLDDLSLMLVGGGEGAVAI